MRRRRSCLPFVHSLARQLAPPSHLGSFRKVLQHCQPLLHIITFKYELYYYQQHVNAYNALFVIYKLLPRTGRSNMFGYVQVTVSHKASNSARGLRPSLQIREQTCFSSARSPSNFASLRSPCSSFTRVPSRPFRGHTGDPTHAGAHTQAVYFREKGPRVLEIRLPGVEIQWGTCRVRYEVVRVWGCCGTVDVVCIDGKQSMLTESKREGPRLRYIRRKTCDSNHP